MSRLAEVLRELVREPDVREVFADLVRDVVVSSVRASELLTVREAAQRLSMSERFVRDAIRDGRLPSRRIGRAVRVTSEDLERLTRRAQSNADTPAARAARIALRSR